MSTKWRTEGRGPAAHSAARVQKKKFSLRERVDPVLPVGLALAALLLAAAWSGVAVLGDRFDWFEAPAQRPVRDDRLLVNVRRDLPQKPLLDAVATRDQRIVISQTGGAVHQLDPATGIWQTESPFADDKRLTPDFVQLSMEPDSSLPDAEGRLWALARDGSLAVREESWRLVTNASRFLDAGGEPVRQEDLSAAAVSVAGDLLAMGTKQGRVGLFSIPDRTWRENPLYDDLGTAVSHMVWWRDRFWIGGAQGLHSASPLDGPMPRDTTIYGAVAAMAADENDGLWVIEKIGVDGAQAARTRVLHFTDPNRQPNVLFDNGGLYPGLNSTGLTYAQQVGDILLLAGDTGIFSYHTIRHTWDRLHDKPVTATLGGRDGFYFGSSGKAGFARPGEARAWSLPAGSLIKIRAGAAGETFGLADNGSLYGLYKSADPRLLFEPKAATMDISKLTTAIGLGDSILFSGPQGAMLHDIHTRRNVTFPKSSGPRMISDPGMNIYRSGDTLFGLASGRGDIFPETLSLNRVKSGDFSRPKLLNPVSGPLRHVRDWDGKGLGMIDGFGRVFLLDRDTRRSLTGGAVDALSQGALLDVAELNQSLVVAGARGIGSYDLNRRAWSQFNPLPGGGVATDITPFRNDLIIRDDQSQLATLDRGRPILIGGDRFRVNDQNLLDAMEVDGKIYLMDNHYVERYDSRIRRVTGSWTVSSADTPLLAGVTGNLPLILSGGQARVGDRVLDRTAGRVANLSTNGYRVWSVRERRGTRYLHVAQSSSSQPDCYFRNPGPGALVRQITDAVQLENGLTAVATNDGLRFYSRTARSWYGAPRDVMPGPGRIYLIDKYLLLVEARAQGYRMWWVSLRHINSPDSCSQKPLSFHSRYKEVSALAVREDRSEVSWITTNGALVTWRGGQERIVIPAGRSGPQIEKMRRVYQFGDQLMFTAGESIFRYDTAAWRWAETKLIAADNFTEVDIARDGGQYLVTAKADNGAIWFGTFIGREDSLSLERLYRPQAGRFGEETITDAQGGASGLWTFVSDRAVRYFDPATRAWLGEAVFEEPASDMTFCRGPGPAVITGNSGKRWFVARDDSAMPKDFVSFDLVAGEKTAVDQNGTVWRLKKDGSLLRGDRPRGKRYVDFKTHARTTRIQPRGVEAAWTLDQLLLIQGAGGLSLIDRSSGQTLPWADGLPVMRRVDGVRRNARLWWISTDAGLLQLNNTQGAPKMRLFQADRLVLDRNGRPWARFGEQWRPWRNNAFEKQVSELRIFAHENVAAAALDADGYPYLWDSQFLRAAHPLPAQIYPDIVDALIAGPDNDWWVLSGRNVYYLTLGSDDEGFPALVIDATVTLDNEPGDLSRLARIRVGADDLEIQSAVGSVLGLSTQLTGGLKVVTRSGGSVVIPGAVSDSWPQISARLAVLPDGSQALDPITDLRVDPAGNLMVVRGSDSFDLGVNGLMDLNPGPALNVGWLAWLRDSGRFVLKTPDDTRFYAPGDFVLDGALLFEPVAAVLAENSERFYAANSAGIFRFEEGDLNLTRPGILFQPLPMQAPITAAHGRFISAGRLVSFKGESLESAPFEVNLGPARVRELADSVEVSLETAAGPVSGAADFGFTWDQDRTGLVYREDGLWLASRAGIHRPFDLTGLVPSPQGQGDLHPEPGVGLMVGRDDQWLRWTDEAWRNSSPPDADRRLLADQVWSWFMEDGRVRMSLADGTELTFRRGAAGLQFSHDALQDAVFVDEQLLVMSDAFFEVAAKGDLGGFRARRLPASRTDRLEVVRPRGGAARVYKHTGNEISVWSPNSSLFRAVDAKSDPYYTRDLVNTGVLRLRRINGRIRLHLQTRDRRGVVDWSPFQMLGGHFPFDVINGVAANGEELFVGSQAGLQIYGDTDKMALADMGPPINPAQNAADGLVGVERLGYGPDRPKALVLQVGRTALEYQSGGSLRVTTPLSEELCVDTPLWRWTRTPQRTVRAFYRRPDGVADLPLKIRDGRLPHDHIRDALVFEGVGYSLWRDGRISVHANGGIGLRDDTVILKNTGPDPRRFVTIKRPMTLAGRLFEAGLYLVDASGDVRRHREGLFERVSSTGFAELIKNPPLLYHDRLRLRRPKPGQTFTFEYRDQQEWRPIPWTRNGLPAIDVWRDLVYFRGRPWAVTPIGLAAFNRDDTNRVYLDPERFEMISALKDNPAGSVGEVRLVGSRLFARRNLDSKQVVWADTVGDDGLVFDPSEADPFAAATYVDESQTGLWVWRLEGRRNGSRGTLTVSIGDRKPQIVAGRFPWDELDSLVHSTNQLELAGPGGWFRAPVNNLSVAGMSRPEIEGINPVDISRVMRIEADGAEGLGLVDTVGGFIRFRSDGSWEQVQQLSELIGLEGFRRYQRNPAGELVMSAETDGLSVVRHLRDGRFSDDVVRGLPYPVPAGYLLPTNAGVLQLDSTGKAEGLIGGPFPGLPEGEPPRAVYVWGDQSVYVGKAGFYDLSSRDLVAACTPDMPAGAQITAVLKDLHGAVRFRWRLEQRVGWSLAAEDDLSARAMNQAFIHLADLAGFREQRLAWGDPEPWMMVQQTEAGLVFQSLDGSRQTQPIPAGALLNTPVLLDDRAFLISPTQLLEVNLDHPMRHLFGNGAE